MKTRFCLLTFATAAFAALPVGYAHWTADQIQDRAKSLPAKMSKVKVATESLGHWGNHSMSLVHREGSGEAELHETQSDILFIRNGDAAIVIGGTIPGEGGQPRTKSAVQKLKAARDNPCTPAMFSTSRPGLRTR